jgi:small subunit ribosomal protein S20
LTLSGEATISGAKLAARLSPPLAFHDIAWLIATSSRDERPGTAGRRTSTGMANTSSARKAARKAARRTEINKGRRSQLRGFVRKVEEAIATGDRTQALAALKAAEPAIMRSAQKGVMHPNAASRKVSRLTHRVAKLGK